jgi:hypothetical protein
MRLHGFAIVFVLVAGRLLGAGAEKSSGSDFRLQLLGGIQFEAGDPLNGAVSPATCALVPGDTNAAGDVYLFDRQAQAATLISHRPGDPGISAGEDANGVFLAPDTRRIAYNTPTTIYTYDRDTAVRTPLLTAYYDPQELVRSSGSDFSADGRRMLLSSWFAKLVPFDGNLTYDTFFLDLDRLFADGFESGNTVSWSQTIP